MIFIWLFAMVGGGDGMLPADTGVFSRALWFVQAYGTSHTLVGEKDREIKSRLAKALINDRELSWDEIEGCVPFEVFMRVAGTDKRISDAELMQGLEAVSPATRTRMYPELRRHADLLTTSFDRIDPSHHAAMERLSDWVVENWKAEGSLAVLTTCTGNSRRSILNAAMGNVAAAYYGFENIRFYSGGTVPSAFNPRTIATLQGIGFQIEATGEEAERGKSEVVNGIYRMRWGKEFEAREYSKRFDTASNPQSGFAAVMVCDEADAECPVVPGAAIRVSMKFLDPKAYDDGDFEAVKYAERRDDIGRTWLAVLASARRKMDQRAMEK